MRYPKEFETVVRVIITPNTHSLRVFDVKAWEPLQFEPSIGEGSSSCGVATLMTARNFFHGESLTW